MDNFQQELQSAVDRAKSLKQHQKELIAKIKENNTRWSYNTKLNYFNALSLFKGDFISEFSFYSKYTLNLNQTWNGSWTYGNYYHIRENLGGLIHKDIQNVGFICEEKHLKEAIDMKKLWKYAVSERGFTKGLDDFNPDNLFEFYQDYLNRNSSRFLYRIHKPSVGVKNIIICI